MTCFFDLSLVLACLVVGIAVALSLWFSHQWGYHNGAMDTIVKFNIALQHKRKAGDYEPEDFGHVDCEICNDARRKPQ